MLRELACISNIQGAPSEFRLLRWGKTETSKGDFIVDAESASAVIKAFTDKGVDMLVDYEHHSVGGQFASPDGRAKAAGWIKAMDARPGDGVYASRIDWTAEARELLTSKAYRYFSPVLEYDTETLRVARLKSVALTNTPATFGAEPLVLKDGDNRSRVCELLALKDDAAESDIVAAVVTLKERAAEAVTLRDQLRRIEGDTLILDAKRAGKLVEAQEPWARTLIAKDADSFKEWLAQAPVIRPQGRTEPPAGLQFQSGERSTAILKAVADYHRAGGREKLCCSLRGFVDAALSEKRLDGVTEAEAKQLIAKE